MEKSPKGKDEDGVEKRSINRFKNGSPGCRLLNRKHLCAKSVFCVYENKQDQKTVNKQTCKRGVLIGEKKQKCRKDVQKKTKPVMKSRNRFGENENHHEINPKWKRSLGVS